MKTFHLSDREIQRFAFDISECEQEIISHIQTCAICKNKAISYQTISKSIRDEQTPAFDFNLTALVLDQLPKPEEQLKGINFLIYFLLILSFVVMSFATYYFSDALINLVNHIPAISNYFILSVAGLIFLPLCWDMYQSFNKKIKMVDFL